MKTKTLKIGTNRGNVRVWLEGADLAEAGWTPGAGFRAKISEGKLEYFRESNPEKAKRNVCGHRDKPVIDTNTKALTKALEGFKKIKVVIRKRKIVVQGILALITAAALLLPTFAPEARNVLVACEYSGKVREAIRAKGHNAISCDILPTEQAGPHYEGDLLDILDAGGFDDVIAFPPCTYLASSGLHWNKRRPGRAKLTEEAVRFVKRIMKAPVERVAIENPIGALSSRIRKPDQIIQPWWFGHPETKATCLWLRGFDKLEATDVVEGREQRIWKMPPSKDRAKLRSMTYSGIAQAMADQWFSSIGQSGQNSSKNLVLAA